MDGNAKLTEKQKSFIREYLKDLNGTKAAIRAGYAKRSAKEIAYENLTKPHILERLEREIKKLTSKQEIGINEILEELKIIGFSNITNYLDFNDGGVTLKDSKKIDPKKLKAIESITTKESEKGNHKSLKLYSKVAALSRLLDYLELQNDNGDKKGILQIEVIRSVIK